MGLFKDMAQQGHEQVVFCYDRVSGLKAIIAIHDTTLGPALGGVRIWPYASEEEALFDVLRLAKGMTYKNAAMGLNLGGGKAVIIADPKKDKTEELFRAFGKFIHSLGGRYITAEDVGSTLDDMCIIRSVTPYVGGLPETSGDPSINTAYGVFRGIQAAAMHKFGSSDLAGRTVAIQGAGKVGTYLLSHLLEAGAKVLIADIFPEKVEAAVKMGAKAVEPGEIFSVECDIFAPCALGGILNDETIPQLKAKVVAGSANNQLLEPRHGKALAERGILYAPDFIVNGGGVINVAQEFEPGGYCPDKAKAKAGKIYDILLNIFALAEEKGILPHEAADLYAEERIRTALEQKRLYLPC
ncbi:MAG: Glu/Leu/Phe/Val dehydrogenase dimerization domain-containing protein [bacterium]